MTMPRALIGSEEHIDAGGTQFIASATTNVLSRSVDPFCRPSGYALSVNGVLDAPPTTTFTYTPDGGLVSDGAWTYAYDAEDQLVSVTSASLTNGALRVLNSYDYRRRRVGKTVERHVDGGWRTTECRAFAYDGWNLIHETVYSVNGATTNVTEIQYFWGPDLSGRRSAA